MHMNGAAANQTNSWKIVASLKTDCVPMQTFKGAIILGLEIHRKVLLPGKQCSGRCTQKCQPMKPLPFLTIQPFHLSYQIKLLVAT